MTPYEELVAFVELETELIQSGKWHDLACLEARRSDLLLKLPANPPQEAYQLLEVVLTRLKRNAAALSAALAHVRGELDRVDRTRSALGSYASQPTSRFHIRG
jgi:hypothetical protein